MAVARYPLSWYVEKLEQNKPFTYLSYGDGEWLVALRERTGRTMQNGEVVTKQLEDEMLESLCPNSSVIRGTDPFLIDYETYQGGDKESIHAIGKKINNLLLNQ